jgi:hypothetical protein
MCSDHMSHACSSSIRNLEFHYSRPVTRYWPRWSALVYRFQASQDEIIGCLLLILDESKADKECCTCCWDTDYIQRWHFILVGFVGTIHDQNINVRIHAEDFKTCPVSAEQCCNNIVSILLVVEDPVPFIGKRC